MIINVLDLFKSQTSKTFDRSKIGQDVHSGERFPSADVIPDPGKRIFKFGTTTTVMHDNLSKKPLGYMKAVQSSSTFDVYADIHVERQKKIISKVKLAKKNVIKLFKPTHRVPAAVLCIDSCANLSVEHGATNVHSRFSSPPSVLQHAKPEARVVTAYESASLLQTIASPTARGENTVGERIEDLASTSCSLVLSPSSAEQLFTTSESRLNTPPSTVSLSDLRTSEEDNGSTEVVIGMADMEQKELVISGSYTSQSISRSAVTVYFSSDTLSDHTTMYGLGLVGSETTTSPVDTSFATSVDAEGIHHSLPGTLRKLRRVPNCEDLRNSYAITNRHLSCSDMSCGSSGCDLLYGTDSDIHAVPLRGFGKCENLRKSFLSSEPKICVSPIRRINKYGKLRTWLNTRRHDSSGNIQKIPASRASGENQKVTPVSGSRQFLQSIFHPSPRIRAHVFDPPPHRPLFPSPPPVWSCAKITQPSTKAKRRQRMTKESMRKLKARLDSVDVDLCY